MTLIPPPRPPKIARVVAVDDVAADTRHLTLEMVDPVTLGFLGGQYVIVDSGVVLPSGKAAKRAHSILSADTQQARFELAVMRLPAGPGSGFLHDLRIGAEIRFSGPWGKLYLAPEAIEVEVEVERARPPRPTLLLATDTGVTAILGLARAQRFAPLLAGCSFVWLRTAPSYFLPEAFVVDRLPRDLAAARIATVAPAAHPERIAACREIVRALQARAPLGQAFLAGDGAVNYALLDDLVAAGVTATRDSVESFFNMPQKKSAAPAT